MPRYAFHFDSLAGSKLEAREFPGDYEAFQYARDMGDERTTVSIYCDRKLVGTVADAKLTAKRLQVVADRISN